MVVEIEEGVGVPFEVLRHIYRCVILTVRCKAECHDRPRRLTARYTEDQQKYSKLCSENDNSVRNF